MTNPAPRGRRDFALLLAAQGSSQLADGMAQATLANVLVLEPLGQDTPGRVLAVSALTLLPYSLVSPFLGVFIDRWPRRGLLVAASAARALVLLAAPLWLDATEGDELIYGVALALLGISRLFLTTKGAALPALVEERDLVRGNAVSGGGGMISALAGGVIGLGLSAWVGDRSTLVAAGLVYAASMLPARAISSPLAHPHARLPSVAAAVVRVAVELGAGLVAVWRRNRVRLALAGIFVLRTVVIFVAIVAILAIKQRYPEGPDRVGRLSTSALALGAAGAGAFLAALTAPIAARRLTHGGLVLLGFGVAATGLLALGAIGNLTAILVLAFVTGYGAFVAKVAVDAQVQEGLPDDYRGRAFALYDILYNLASVVAAALMLAVAESGSFRVPLLVAGAATVALAGGLAAEMARAGMLAGAGTEPEPGGGEGSQPRRSSNP
jgi:MFS family permease